MHFSVLFISSLGALTAAASPRLEERQNNGAAYCGVAAARANCNLGSTIPFPVSGTGGCYGVCYCGPGGAHTFYQPCVQCVASYYPGTNGINGPTPAACSNMLKGPCTQNNAPCVNGEGPLPA